MTRVTITLAVGLTLTAVGILATLARSPLMVVGGNYVQAQTNVELEKGSVSSCQPAGTLPRGTSAIRIAMETRAVGPEVSLRVLSGSHIVTQGRQPAGWGVAPTVTVPVRSLAQTVDKARICIAVGPAVEPFRFRGEPALSPSAEVNKLQDVTLRMEYLRPGSQSWWSLASSISYHMGLGRAPSGTWVAFLALALMLAISILASRLGIRELR
jgi:hypothetical protein